MDPWQGVINEEVSLGAPVGLASWPALPPVDLFPLVFTDQSRVEQGM